MKKTTGPIRNLAKTDRSNAHHTSFPNSPPNRGDRTKRAINDTLAVDISLANVLAIGEEGDKPKFQFLPKDFACMLVVHRFVQ